MIWTLREWPFLSNESLNHAFAFKDIFISKFISNYIIYNVLVTLDLEQEAFLIHFSAL
jgi:hypothetical protein